MPLQAGDQLGPYTILALLGKGGMGEVYRARDTRLGREVAVKVLRIAEAGDPARQRRFAQEARAAGNLSHPNIVSVFDVGEQDGMSYIVCELVKGKPLDAMLRESGKLPVGQVVSVACQIADALIAAHAGGLAHRDLKPANVMITDSGGVKVLDFGLAKRVAVVENASALAITELHTTPGIIVGTVAYMSPEQVRGQSVDAGTDIWSFGITLYQMLTGTIPFHQATQADTMAAIIQGEPPSLAAACPECPAELANLVARCLRKDRAQRFRTAQELRGALEGVAAVVARAGGRSRRGWVVAALALPAAAGVGYLIWPRWTAPVPAVRRTLRYSLWVQPAENGEPLGEAYAAREAVLQPGWKFQMRMEAGESGALYMLNESKEAPGYQILFPLPAANAGDSTLRAGVPTRTGWFVVDGEADGDRVWLIWCGAAENEMEKIVRKSNREAKGVIGKRAEVEFVRKMLEGRAAEAWPAGEGVRLTGDGPVVVHSVRMRLKR